jgi:hypothetical protein
MRASAAARRRVQSAFALFANEACVRTIRSALIEPVGQPLDVGVAREMLERVLQRHNIDV